MASLTEILALLREFDRDADDEKLAKLADEIVALDDEAAKETRVIKAAETR